MGCRYLTSPKPNFLALPSIRFAILQPIVDSEIMQSAPIAPRDVQAMNGFELRIAMTDGISCPHAARHECASQTAHGHVTSAAGTTTRE
jgi:hypothetical protein